ncbi:unnamed protein product [Amoebophrya sp. A25]|nr:unnamed protein product [Amoebophrya sp. A25]CAD7977093.1 unnamed protein product [Amoebophrya sp. A25]|eukprot:GSA25T00027857001.1
MKWFKSEGPGHAYAHVPASSMKVQRAKSAGDVRNLKTHVTHSVMPYASRFLNNRVPPGGGPLMRTSWSGQYMEWLWSTGHDFGHRHSSNLKNGSSIFFNPKASQKGDDKNTTYKWDTKNSMAELYLWL